MADIPPRAELLRAAGRLRYAAEAAKEDLKTNGYWSGSPAETAWRDGVRGGLGGPAGDLAGLMGPDVALAVAAVLERHANGLAHIHTPENQEIVVGPHALVIARSVNRATVIR